LKNKEQYGVDSPYCQTHTIFTMKTITQLFGLVLLALQAFEVHADIYEYIDEQGVSHYSNVPSDARYQLIIAEPTINHVKATEANNNTTQQLAARELNVVSPAPEIIAQIEQSATTNQLDSELIQAVMYVESGNKPKARSAKGAQGLMQLMPATAKRLGVIDSFDPLQNIEGGAKYLRVLLDLFNNDVSLALAGYNAGEYAVMKYGNRIPPYQETQAYVPKG
jgi:soluble lytic murein transglycosylase-like protein